MVWVMHEEPRRKGNAAEYARGALQGVPLQGHGGGDRRAGQVVRLCAVEYICLRLVRLRSSAWW